MRERVEFHIREAFEPNAIDDAAVARLVERSIAMLEESARRVPDRAPEVRGVPQRARQRWRPRRLAVLAIAVGLLLLTGVAAATVPIFDGRTAIEQMGIFDEAGTTPAPKDVREDVAERFPAGTPGGAQVDEFEPAGSERRVLSTRTDTGTFELFAYPTTNGWVCMSVASDPGINASCVPGFDADTPASIATRSDAERWLVYGLVPDEVVQVDALTADGDVPAIMGDGGFLATSPEEGAAFPSELRLTFEDGATATMAVER